MVKVLDPRTQAGVTPEIQSLKNQLTDKEKMIQQLEVRASLLRDLLTTIFTIMFTFVF